MTHVDGARTPNSHCPRCGSETGLHFKVSEHRVEVAGKVTVDVTMVKRVCADCGEAFSHSHDHDWIQEARHKANALLGNHPNFRVRPMKLLR